MSTILSIVLASLPLIILFLLRRDLQKRKERSELREKYSDAKIFKLDRKQEETEIEEEQTDDFKKSA